MTFAPTGGLKKDRELADEIVWWCMETLMPRHSAINIDVKLTKTSEEWCRRVLLPGR